jgi:hypothetical protein
MKVGNVVGAGVVTFYAFYGRLHGFPDTWPGEEYKSE